MCWSITHLARCGLCYYFFVAKVLIVEDSKELCEALTTAFELKGLEVLAAYDGIKAVSMALAEKPDLTIVDLRLPDISGYDVIRKIRADEWGKTASIIILTSSDEVDKIPPDVGISDEDYLTKTKWSIASITDKVLSVLERDKAGTPA